MDQEMKIMGLHNYDAGKESYNTADRRGNYNEQCTDYYNKTTKKSQMHRVAQSTRTGRHGLKILEDVEVHLETTWKYFGAL